MGKSITSSPYDFLEVLGRYLAVVVGEEIGSLCVLVPTMLRQEGSIGIRGRVRAGTHEEHML